MPSIHVSGLGSGMDIGSMIEQLIEAERKPIELLEEERSEINDDAVAWADISSYMTDLTDSLDTLRSMTLWDTMSAISSNEDYLTATANSSAEEATYLINITQLAQAQSVGSAQAATLTPGGTSTTDLVAAGVLTAGNQFTIEGQTVTIGATETLESLEGKINTAADSMAEASRVHATIVDNRLIITREKTGSSTINMTDTTGNPLQDLQVLNAGGAFVNEFLAGQDAQFTVNGATVTRSDNTNLDDVIQNVTLNLHEETLGSTITLTVQHDRDAAKTAIQDFIDKYNAAAEIMEEYGKITVSGNNVDGAELETVGELADDTLLRTIMSKIRRYATDNKYPTLNEINASYTYNGQTGICDTLSAIGIWTEGEENRLAVTDDTRLDHMLNNEFDTVEQLFRGVYDPSEGYTGGVASDFYAYSNNVSQSLTGEIASHIQNLDDDMEDIDETILAKEERLAEYEQRLWEEFTRMDEAMKTMQDEIAYIKSKFGDSGSGG
jgi:flagellar hook-associated protein 2